MSTRSSTSPTPRSCRRAPRRQSARPDALFRDPLAARLSGEHGRAIAERFAADQVQGLVRRHPHRLITSYPTASLRHRTILNLGAGLQMTRPYSRTPASLAWIRGRLPVRVRAEGRASRRRSAALPARTRGARPRGSACAQGLFHRLEARAGRVLVLTEGLVPYLETSRRRARGRPVPPPRGRAVDCRLDGPEVMRYRERAGVDARWSSAVSRLRAGGLGAFFVEHDWRAAKGLLFDGSRCLGGGAPLPGWVR